MRMHSIDHYDWPAIHADLDAQGSCILPALLSAEECRLAAAMFPDDVHFRSHVHMARHGFGRGEYKYFGYPLPPLVSMLRTALYPHLMPIANGWNERLGVEGRYPDQHQAYLDACHAAGQARPTPLLPQW
jgi:hypothetical protein